MKRNGKIGSRHMLLSSALIALSSFSIAQSDGRTGWTTLIANGSGLESFDVIGGANWRVEDDAVVADDGSGGFLVTKKPYKDFVLEVEFWADATTNSGIYFRCTDATTITDTGCYEANIFDQRPEAQFGTGAIVHISPVAQPYPAGERWNTLRITAIGSHLTVTLNGVQTANVRDTKLQKGAIALQYGVLPNDARGGAIKWRKVEIKPL